MNTLLVLAGSTYVGINSLYVDEIAVPGPAGMGTHLNYKGKLIPVISLNKMFEDIDPVNVNVVLCKDANDNYLALVVDTIIEMFQPENEGEIFECPDVMVLKAIYM